MDSRTTVEPQLCLASMSPRRALLLEQIGIDFVSMNPAIDESSISAQEARERVRRVARAKARSASAAGMRMPILAADTAVVCDDCELGKPDGRDHAMEMLSMLSGRSHWVYTAVVLRCADTVLETLGATEVWFRNMKTPEIAAYCDSAEPYDKAGAYAIQGRAAVFIRRIEGSYSNVVGLPLYETAAMLKDAGISQ